jgi:hypothetical protein
LFGNLRGAPYVAHHGLGTVTLCNPAFSGQFTLAATLAVEVSKAQSGLTIAREYEFQAWVQKLLNPQ